MPYARLGNLDQLTLPDTASCKNPCVILTMDNVVQFLDDVELSKHDASTAIASLPTAFRPAGVTVLPCVYKSDEKYELVPVTVSADGDLVIAKSGTLTGTLCMRGKCFNISSVYHNGELKNNFKQGTSNY